ncbi:MAG: hypothetical protein JW852_02805 [Spirochaetales bacterium]|nr:hypothetical protein [Spirochaetales bacterium]
MFERLGIITNCFKNALENGAGLEELVVSFCSEGFSEIEVRDGDYLRACSFGKLLGKVEKIVPNYDPGVWRQICERIHLGRDWRELVRREDLHVIEEADWFITLTAGAFYSYSMTYPWLSPPQDPASDDRRVVTAAGIAYLFNPAQPRLRLVSLEAVERIDHDAATANLKRYRSRIRVFSPIFTIENARHPALEMRELALAGEALLTYDEANNYLLDGTELSSVDEFRRVVKIEELASVHMKQKNKSGVSTGLADGYVDLRAVLTWLDAGNYTGDLLLEFAPTDEPLQDAVSCRNYLHGLFGR